MSEFQCVNRVSKGWVEDMGMSTPHTDNDNSWAVVETSDLGSAWAGARAARVSVWLQSLWDAGEGLCCQPGSCSAALLAGETYLMERNLGKP